MENTNPTAKPFSPQSLAERWGCSAEKVRQMVRRDELAGFRLGKLIRIAAIEVERYECLNTASSSTESNGPSPTELRASELRLARMTAGALKPSLPRCGEASTALLKSA
jgi:excisionase family DNA binding protein